MAPTAGSPRIVSAAGSVELFLRELILRLEKIAAVYRHRVCSKGLQGTLEHSRGFVEGIKARILPRASEFGPDRCKLAILHAYLTVGLKVTVEGRDAVRERHSITRLIEILQVGIEFPVVQ